MVISPRPPWPKKPFPTASASPRLGVTEVLGPRDIARRRFAAAPQDVKSPRNGDENMEFAVENDHFRSVNHMKPS